MKSKHLDEDSSRPFRTEAEEAAYIGVSTAALRRWRSLRIGPPFSRPPGKKSVVYWKDKTDRWLAQGASR